MSALAKLQADFQAYILDSTAGEHFKTSIIDDEKVGVDTRLGIYYNAYRLRIIEVLISAYPNVAKLLGDDLFDEIARSYINNHPSTYRNMRWVGDRMPQHLATALPAHPIAAELAQFEWALGLAFDAEDTPLLTLEALATIPPESWESITLSFHPSFQRLNFSWQVIPVWQALEADDAPTLSQTPQTCIVWRQDMQSYFRSIDADEESAMTFVQQGYTFGALCEHIIETTALPADAATQQAATYLSSWLNASLLRHTL